MQTTQQQAATAAVVVVGAAVVAAAAAAAAFTYQWLPLSPLLLCGESCPKNVRREREKVCLLGIVIELEGE